ncbi:MAG: hypothetical protein ACP5UD_06165 [Conexivisphaera sp.]
MLGFEPYLDQLYGILLGVALTVLFEHVIVREISIFWRKIMYKRINKHLEKLGPMLEPIKILQAGKLGPASVHIHIAGYKKVPKEVHNIIEAHTQQFKEQGFSNNRILSVGKILFIRKGKDEKVNIDILGYLSSYYHFLATNANIKLRNDLTEDEKKWVISRIPDQEHFDPNIPVDEFANPLSVEVLLLCEAGKKAVLTRRSRLTVFRGDMIGPSVMETVSPELMEGSPEKGEIDVFRTIKRGIEEELGIKEHELKHIYITSLDFDKEVFDYKFTAIATTYLSEAEIKRRYELAVPKDKYENTELLFLNFPVSKREIGKLYGKLSPEAVACIHVAAEIQKNWIPSEEL